MAISEEKQIPCVYRFRNNWITVEDIFNINGFCRECKSSINGVGEQIDDANFKFKIITYATHEIKHYTKRKLTGKRRAELRLILSGKTPGEYREEELAKMKTKHEPPHLNRSGTLGKVREEGLNEKLGFSEYKKLSITNRKLLSYCDVRKLSLLPFYLWYWSDEQVRLWNFLREKNLPLSLDATGSLVRKYSYYPNAPSKALFIYVLVIGFAGKIIPLLQAILSIHDVCIIQELLANWIECGAKIPKEIRTDGSLALQNGICLSFNGMTFKNYNLECFKRLIGEINDLPVCYLRHDVAHLLNTIRKWKCFKLFNSTVIDFFLRSVGYLTQVETVQQFEHIVISILIVANSETAPVNSICDQRKTILLELFRTYKCTLDKFYDLAEQSNSHINNEQNEKELKNLDNTTNDLIKYVDRIFKTALNMCESDEEISDKANFYFCPEFTKNFQNVCNTFPTWTNVMRQHFGSPNEVGSSARSETNFKDTKNRIPRPIVVQKYLLHDKQKRQAMTNFGFSQLPENSIPEKPTLDTQLDILHLNLDSLKLSDFKDNNNSAMINPSSINSSNVEDFIPSTTSSPIASVRFHTWSNPQLSCSYTNVEQSLASHCSPVTRNLIINGNHLPYKKYLVDKSEMKFINTCPFDSIFELFTTAYVQSNHFAKAVEQKLHDNISCTLNAVVDYCKSCFDQELFYINRAQILYAKYNSKSISTKNLIQCKDNITNAFEYFIESFPSFSQKIYCHMCKNEVKKSHYSRSLSAKQLYNIGITHLQDTLEDILCDKITVCQKCNKKTAHSSYNINDYLLLDLEYLHERKNFPIIKLTVEKDIDFKTKFQDIPLQLKLKDQLFQLTGIISFEGDPVTEIPDVIVHYKTYALSSNNEWILFNDLEKTVQILEHVPEDKIALLMYTKSV